MRAPQLSGRYSSSAAMSKDSEVTATSTSSAVMPGAACMLRMKCDNASWRTITPLGLPVEPEV